MTLLLTMWDVQHGSANHLLMPGGGYFVIDLGVGDITGSNETFSPLQYLRQIRARVDEVLITHPHRDHLDDIFNFDPLAPRTLRRPRHLTEQDIRAGNRPGDSPILDKYLEIDQRYCEPVTASTNPEQAAVNGGVGFAFFTSKNCPTDNLNNHSIITFVSYAGTTFCIPGDNEAPSWKELLADGTFCCWLAATHVLIAPHHGREAGYCEDIFSYCTPLIVLVSDGPESDTSAVDKYRTHARGWEIRSRSTGKREKRWVLTTRCDGTINVSAYSQSNQNYLDVSIE